MSSDDGTPNGKSTTDGGDYFYRNPYVGRVLDGYACAENCTVDNTDKNYTIQRLQAGKSDLTVSEGNDVLNATVASEQGLWLLSAIINSGAGAMDSTGSYTDVDGVVDAYQYGKPRTATYEGIGTDAGTDADTRLADENTGVEMQVLQEVMVQKQSFLSGQELYNRYHSSKAGRKEQ